MTVPLTLQSVISAAPQGAPQSAPKPHVALPSAVILPPVTSQFLTELIVVPPAISPAQAPSSPCTTISACNVQSNHHGCGRAVLRSRSATDLPPFRCLRRKVLPCRSPQQEQNYQRLQSLLRSDGASITLKCSSRRWQSAARSCGGKCRHSFEGGLPVCLPPRPCRLQARRYDPLPPRCASGER